MDTHELGMFKGFGVENTLLIFLTTTGVVQLASKFTVQMNSI